MNIPVIILATNNAHKKQEFQHAFNTKILSPSDLGILDFDPLENGTTFDQNAAIKAQALYNILQTHSNIPQSYIIVADDSGLCVDVLQGKPGIFSARYAYMQKGDMQCNNASDKENRNALIFALKQHGVWGSKAFFQCSIAYIIKQPNVPMQQNVVSGKCDGVVAIKELGEHGFGYDSMFYKDFEAVNIENINFSLHSSIAEKSLQSLQHSLATLPLAKKAEISHRGQAIIKLQEILMSKVADK